MVLPWFGAQKLYIPPLCHADNRTRLCMCEGTISSKVIYHFQLASHPEWPYPSVDGGRFARFVAKSEAQTFMIIFTGLQIICFSLLLATLWHPLNNTRVREMTLIVIYGWVDGALSLAFKRKKKKMHEISVDFLAMSRVNLFTNHNALWAEPDI